MNILHSLFGAPAAENEEEVQRMERRMGMLPQAPNPMTNGPTMPQPGLMPIGGIPGSNTIPDASRFVPPGLPGLSMDQAQAALNTTPPATSDYHTAVNQGGFQAPPMPPRRPVSPGLVTPMKPHTTPQIEYASLGAQAAPQVAPQKTYSDSVYGATQNYEDNFGKGSSSNPGDGIRRFVGNGGLQTFKAADVGSSDFQGPVLPHAMTGQKVGTVEGSPASFGISPAGGSPMDMLAKLFMGGGF